MHKNTQRTKAQLIDTITAIAQYHVSNFEPLEAPIPENFLYHVGYIIACFAAQSTAEESCGVEMEWPIVDMKLATVMGWDERRELATNFINEVWKASGNKKLAPYNPG